MLNHTVQQTMDPYYRRVVCGVCTQPFVVNIHNVEKILISHVCAPQWKILGIKNNGN